MWALAIALALAVAVCGFDMGPTYGMDYAGLDYNITNWNSSSARALNHYLAVAKECEAYCAGDPKCCAWTYAAPDGGQGEQCCLKQAVGAEVPAGHRWTGLSARAIKDGKISAQCAPPPAPPTGCTTIGGKCVMPYPGDDWTHPRIHQSPDCLHLDGWHDMAGALTHNGEHHVFQGCPASLGWSHSASSDLVHWENRGRGVHMLHETAFGMDPTSCGPCSGFVAVGDDGVPCAGFRQCGSGKGATGLNPQAHDWDVPMELR